MVLIFVILLWVSAIFTRFRAARAQRGDGIASMPPLEQLYALTNKTQLIVATVATFAYIGLYVVGLPIHSERTTNDLFMLIPTVSMTVNFWAASRVVGQIDNFEESALRQFLRPGYWLLTLLSVGFLIDIAVDLMA